MSEKDVLVWRISTLLESYREYPDMQEMVLRKMNRLFLFFEENGLIRSKVSDGRGNIIKDILWKSEFTDDGLRLIMGSKNSVNKWLKSKGSQKNPPDMSILQKELSTR